MIAWNSNAQERWRAIALCTNQFISRLCGSPFMRRSISKYIDDRSLIVVNHCVEREMMLEFPCRVRVSPHYTDQTMSWFKCQSWRGRTCHAAPHRGWTACALLDSLYLDFIMELTNETRRSPSSSSELTFTEAAVRDQTIECHTLKMGCEKQN